MAESNSKQLGAKITLYWLERSRSHRILWLLEELGLDYELKTYKRGSDQMAPAELKAIHPLGKSPVVKIEAPGASEPKVIAESALIIEYLCEHFGKHLIPERYPTGSENQLCGETEEYFRYRYYMHYAEGSLMPYLVIQLVMNQLKGPAVPFFVRPITRVIASQVENSFLNQNHKSNLDFLESQIKSSPGNGEFLCGAQLTAADIMMIFPLQGAQTGAGLTKEDYPLLTAYIDRLTESPAYKRAIKKVEETSGEKFTVL
ncbi:thioredoxin-like protein [Tothia fuscella]|uniref:glutathione transferase n=1 Tax=Tothia fuscella TaxID=1048955 RepID=A0A9P4NTL9_9PEZI|nr:thioredoxin-like protein [Tothia fuscella]